MIRTLAALAFTIGLATAAAAEDRPCRSVTFEGDAFTVCTYDPASETLRLADYGPAGPLGGFEGLRAYLGRDGKRVAFAMNAGMYTTDQRPLGLYVEAGKKLTRLNTRKGAGNFYLKPNGVFWTDAEGRPHLTETGVYANEHPKARWATQSGPLLVADGQVNVRLAPNGPSLNIRNGVGVKGGQAYFVISDTPVSFGRTARFFHDSLGCADALYFDGSVSSLWAPALNREDRRSDLGTFVVVLSRR